MLKPNHVKALSLIRENKMSMKEIAAACKMSVDHLYDLQEGSPKTGSYGQEFQREMQKIEKEISNRTKTRIKTLKDKLIEELDEWNDSLPKGGKLTIKDFYAKRALLAELNKASAGVEIGEFHYHTGLEGADLVNEFKRVRSLVESAADGSGIPEAVARRSGILPVSPEDAATGTEEGQTSELPPEPEAGEIPQE